MRKRVTLGEIVDCLCVNEFRLSAYDGITHSDYVVVPDFDISRYCHFQVGVIGVVDQKHAVISLLVDSLDSFRGLKNA